MGRKRQLRHIPAESAALIRDTDLPDAYTLMLDGLAQSHVDLADPMHLTFEYMRRFAYVIDLVGSDPDSTVPPDRMPSRDPLRVAHLGGGAATMARYVAAVRPRSAQVVVEASAEVIEAARSIGVPDGIRIRHADASTEVRTLRDQDVILVDVFADARVPQAFAEPGFVEAATTALKPSGILAWNVGDGGRMEYSRTLAATLRLHLEHLTAIAESSVFGGRRFGNVVLVGSRQPLPLSSFGRRAAADPTPARVDPGFGSEARAFGLVPPRQSDPPPAGL